MANPFTVQPLGGLQNLQMINQGMQGIGENFQAQQEQERKQALMQQAGEIMERGNPQEIARFRMANPDIGEDMVSGIEFANDATKQNMKSSMQRIISGADISSVLEERAQMVEANGGDASQTRSEQQVLERMGPEAYRRMIANQYAMQYGTEGVPGTGGDEMKRADTLRGEVNKLAKNLGVADTFAAMNRIEASNNGTAPGDLALIFNYMKMLDPGSTVREGEFATAQNATGVEGRIRNAYNQAISGERLSPEQRKQFTNSARKIYKQAQTSFKQAAQPIINLAEQSNISTDTFLGEGYFDSFGVSGSDGGSSSIMDMDRSQLNSLVPSELSDEELQQAAERYEQLGAQ